MSPRTGPAAALAGLLAWAALVAGCATPTVVTERRPDGVYHLKCQTPLQLCLNRAEVLCERQRYVVLRAVDLDNYTGPSDRRTELRTSEAFVRCGFSASWGAENKELLATDVCPSEASPPPRGCTPGASAACVGPAGCQGGQVCAPDGKTLGPCDCGPPAVAPADP